MSDDDCPDLIAARVPVCILTGFLGSGKTTLLNYILTQDHKLKIAVIVNEFEFGRSIEKGLTMKSAHKSDDEWLELNNGCLCCTAKTQTVLALENLIAKQGSLDLIMIETSGLADPSPIANTFWQDDALQSNIYLAGIITVVDCMNIRQYLQGNRIREARQQLLAADKLLLNKSDLLGSNDADDVTERDAVEKAVRDVNPFAPITFTSFSRIAPESLRTILKLNTTDRSALTEYLTAKAASMQAVAANHGHSLDLTVVQLEMRDRHVPSKKKLDEMVALLLDDADDESEDIDSAAMQLAKRGRIEECDDNDAHSLAVDAAGGGRGNRFGRIVRVKAAVRVGEDPTSYMQVQSIGDTFETIIMAGAAGGLPEHTSRFLILGDMLKQDQIKDHIEKYFVA